MSWEEIVPPLKGATATAAVRVGMTCLRKTAAPRLFVLLRASVLGVLEGVAGRYRVDVGSVEHRHLLRIRADDSGPFGAVQLGRKAGDGEATMRLILPPAERFPMCSVKAQEVEWKHDKVGKCLLVTLPSWAWDEAQKRDVEKRAAAAAKVGGS